MNNLWWLLPLLVMLGSISWALWWPVKSGNWFAWFDLAPRLVVALVISMLCWMISAVFQ
jgi:hypothetical protein